MAYVEADVQILLLVCFPMILVLQRGYLQSICIDRWGKGIHTGLNDERRRHHAITVCMMHRYIER